jgi:predicted nucleic acid-binding protein
MGWTTSIWLKSKRSKNLSQRLRKSDGHSQRSHAISRMMSGPSEKPAAKFSAPVFLDTSAIAKLYHKEIGSEFLEQLVEKESVVLVSRLGAVEMQSVLSGKVRTRTLTEHDAELAQRRVRTDVRRKRIRIVALRNRHYELAASLIEKHANNQGLRTQDSLQLAVAVDLAQNGLVDSFVTADKVLVRLAGIENVKVSDPEVPNP